jgi:hypothetical protein
MKRYVVRPDNRHNLDRPPLPPLPPTPEQIAKSERCRTAALTKFTKKGKSCL